MNGTYFLVWFSIFAGLSSYIIGRLTSFDMTNVFLYFLKLISVCFQEITFSKNAVLLLLRRSYSPASLHNCCSSTPEWRVPHTSNIKMQNILNNFPLQNGLRVLTFDRHHAMLVVSKPSPNNLFPGYGIVKVKLDISLQKYHYVSLKFVGLQYLHMKVCFVTYFMLQSSILLTEQIFKKIHVFLSNSGELFGLQTLWVCAYSPEASAGRSIQLPWWWLTADSWNGQDCQSHKYAKQRRCTDVS